MSAGPTRIGFGLVLGAAALASAVPASASPDLPLDHPSYGKLAILRAEDQLPAYDGGVRPLTTARVRALLGHRPQRGWWLHPIDRLALRFNAARDTARPYSTPLHVRDVAGALSVTCEHREGRPCGNGVGGFGDLDASAGYGTWIAASIRVRARGGTDAYEEKLDLNRGSLSTELGPVAVKVGREVLVLGPASRTQLGWGDNTAPLDQVRINTSRPLELGTPRLHGNLVYVLGRLRDPQTYPHTLVSIVRGQLDVGRTVEVGMMQLLQLGGDGAPPLDTRDFLLAHVRQGAANRRIGLDVSWMVGGLHGARLYYQIVFEDLRKHVEDAVRYDADHLFGVELAALGKHGLLFELQKTGVRSEEHAPRRTGFTNAGRVVGSPLGPDALAAYLGLRLALGRTTLLPWIELASLSSDTYAFIIDGPILHTRDGRPERRQRGGVRVRVALRPNLALEAEGVAEHVDSFGFVAGARRNNFGISTALVWFPAWAR